MSRVSDAMLIEFIQRRNLPPSDPLHIGVKRFKDFLDGRLVLREAGAATSAGRLMETGILVERLIKAGYHKMTNSGEGMKASAYRKLWPRIVTQPLEYAGRFDELLLVDTTIELDQLVHLSNFIIYTDPKDCQDLAPTPLDKDGKPAVRYIAFVQLGQKNLKLAISDCRTSFSPDEIGLVTREGLHLPIQHEPYLRQYVVDLSGSACGESRAPCVSWFGDTGPLVDAHNIRYWHQGCGSASRGSKIIAIS